MNPYLAWAQIDLSAFSHNLKELRRVTQPSAKFMAVIKADAYGHGALRLAEQARNARVDWLGVAHIHEGLVLRQAGIDLPILIFGHTPENLAPTLVAHHLTPTVYSLETARGFSHFLSKGNTLPVHVKIDTGMGRLGLLASNADSTEDRAMGEVKAIEALKGIQVQGVYTHFANADAADKTHTLGQLKRFLGFLDGLKAMGVQPEIAHAANSAAVIDLPETHLDLVRPGISIYGSYPSEDVDKNRVALKPVMRLMTKIIHLKKVPKGFTVSYNMTHKTKNPTLIATVPIGYADGYNRLLSSKGVMGVRGRKAPVVGRVCMDLTTLDVGHIPGVAVGDEVLVFGCRDGESIPVEDLARAAGTISYEIYTRIGDRIQRVYVKP